jgi:hypothetical protein
VPRDAYRIGDSRNFKEEEEEKGLVSEFTSGFSSGVDTTLGTLGGVRSLFNTVTGDEEEAIEYLNYARQKFQDASESSGTVESIEEIDGADDFVRWALYSAGTVVPSIATSVLGGGVGGFAAKKGAEKFVKDKVKKEVYDRVQDDVSEAAKKRMYRETLAGKVQPYRGFGQGAGAFTASAAQNTGSTYLDIYEETGIEAPDVALAAGVASGALDAITPFVILRRIMPPTVFTKFKDKMSDRIVDNGGVIRRSLLEATKQAGFEGFTEATQELIQATAVGMMRNDPAGEFGFGDYADAFVQQLGEVSTDDQLRSRLLNAAAVGAIGGTFTGGVSGLAKGEKKRVDDSTKTKEPEAEEDSEQQPAETLSQEEEDKQIQAIIEEFDGRIDKKAARRIFIERQTNLETARQELGEEQQAREQQAPFSSLDDAPEQENLELEATRQRQRIVRERAQGLGGESRRRGVAVDEQRARVYEDQLNESMGRVLRGRQVLNEIVPISLYEGTTTPEENALAAQEAERITVLPSGPTIELGPDRTMESLERKTVDYQGIQGTLTRRDDGVYEVVTPDGQNVVVESGESDAGSTAAALLGVRPVDINVDTPSPDIQFNPEDQTFIARNKKYRYVGTRYDDNGNPVAIDAETMDGQPRVFRSQRTLNAMEAAQAKLQQAEMTESLAKSTQSSSQVKVEMDDLPASVQKKIIEQSDQEAIPDQVFAQEAIDIAQSMPDAEGLLEIIEEAVSFRAVPLAEDSVPPQVFTQTIRRPEKTVLSEAIAEINKKQPSQRTDIDEAKIDSLFTGEEVPYRDGKSFVPVDDADGTTQNAKAEIKTALIDLFDAGMPKAFLSGVNGLYVHGNILANETNGVYSKSKGFVSIYGSLIKASAKDQDNQTDAPAKLRYVLAHELGHAFDVTSNHTANSPEFSIEVTAAATTHIDFELGSVMAELADNFNNKTELGLEFAYPFGTAFDMLNQNPQNGAEVVRQEAFAQAFAVFHSTPEILKQYAPVTYNYMQSLLQSEQIDNGQGQNASTTDVPETSGVRRDVRPQTELRDVQVQDSGGDRGDGGRSPVEEQAGQGMDQPAIGTDGDSAGRPVQLEETQQTEEERLAEEAELESDFDALADDDMLSAPVSTRFPSAVRSTEDPLSDLLVNDYDSYVASSDMFAKNMLLVKKYNNLTKREQRLSDKNASLALIDHIKGNLLSIFDAVPDATRAISKQWYKGANKIVQRMADKHGITMPQASAVAANLSPQKNWYQNASLAERVLDIFHNEKSAVFDDQMKTRAEEIFFHKAVSKKSRVSNREMLDIIGDKSLQQLIDEDAGTAILGMWIRTWDQTYNSPSFRLVSPDGKFLDYATNADGKTPSKVAWGSLDEIGKAVSVLLDPSQDNVSLSLGSKNKVRNFYNNIFDPDSEEGFVTIDTHAVAAGLMKPLSGDSLEVSHNFGTGKGTSSSAITGHSGTYSIYEEAYRQAAKERGVLAREMQSITWEAVRGLFTATYKANGSNVVFVEGVWNQYNKGQISLEEARTKINGHSGGIQRPDWERSDFTVPDEVSETSYERKLPDGGVSRPESGSQEISRSGTGVDAAGVSSDQDLLNSPLSLFNRGVKQDPSAATFSGKMDTNHGYRYDPEDGNTPIPNFVKSKDFKGFRFDGDGGTFGSDGVYLEDASAPAYFNQKDMTQFMPQRRVSVEADFAKAFVFTPATVQELKSVIGVHPKDIKGAGRGAKIVSLLKDRGYDGLIVKDFKSAEMSDYKQAQNQLEREGMGPLDDELVQPQIFAFYPERLKVDADSMELAKDFLFSPPTYEEANAARNAVIREEKKAVDQASSWLTKTFKRQLTSRGLLNEQVFQAKIARDGEFGAAEIDTRMYLNSYDKAVKDADLTEEQTALLSQAIATPLDQLNSLALPEEVKQAIGGMRKYLDKMSIDYAAVVADQALQLAQSGKGEAAAAKVDLLNTIASNKGKYLNRSYQVFDDPNWANKVSDEVINDARELLESNGAQNADRIINTILKEGTAFDGLSNFISEGNLGSKDLSILKKRKDIAPEILALMGEYTDPRINFVKTATKVSRLLWNHRFLERVKLEGQRDGFLFTAEDAPTDAYVQIAPDSSDAMNPLNGLYTTPELAQGFKDAMDLGSNEAWVQTWQQINSVVKYGKTVIAPTTIARNFMSASFFTIANGHFNWAKADASLKSLDGYFSSKEGDATAYLREIRRLGVVYDSPYAGELTKALEDFSKGTELDNKVRAIDGLTDTAIQKSKSFLDLMAKNYQYGDDFWKIIGFENMVDVLMENKGISREEAMPLAAERIRDTYPTYSLIGKGIKDLRRFPLVGTFVSFPAEIVRTSFNMFKYLKQDMADPDMSGHAMAKVAGMSAVSFGIYALQEAALSAFDVDEEEQEAIRLMSPTWSENSNILPTGRDENGNLEYIDLTYLDPYAYFKKPINALMRDQPTEDAIVQAGRELLTPFFGVDIATNTALEIYNNERVSGGRIWNPSDTPANKLSAATEHLIKGAGPAVIQNVTRTAKAINGAVSKSGKRYELEDELRAWVGFRVTTFDPKISLHFKAYEFNQDKRNATSLLTSTFRDPNELDAGELENAFDRASSARREGYERMIKLVSSAKKAGLSNTQLMVVLRSNGVTLKDAKALIAGNPATWRMSDSTLKNSIKKSDLLFGESTSREFERRWRIIQRLLREESQDDKLNKRSREATK